MLLIEATAPNALHDYAILWTEGVKQWGYGRDRTLRYSGDNGVTWGKLSNSGTARWGLLGIFLKTAAGSFITTSHASGAATPSIVRSTNSGLSFSQVIAADPNIDYQGVTSIAQDPVTGYIYLAEYVTVAAATKPTWSILRSTDDGATWAAFHTFNRSGAAPIVRHGHGCQWDPIGLRMFFLTGDSEDDAGIYRVDAAGAGVEPVFLNKHRADLLHGNPAGAVGMMFFPNYIAWGMDATTDSYLIRLARDQIGLASPVYERGARLNSTAFHCVRTKTDSTEWLMAVSNENIGAGSVDLGIHLHRVADDAATVDEVYSTSVLTQTDTRYFYPVGSPLQANADGQVWLSSIVTGPLDRVAAETSYGQQIAVRLGWGGGCSMPRPDIARRPFYVPQTQSSGNCSMGASETRVFGGTRVPARTRRLFIMDLGCLGISGGGSLKVQVWNATTGAVLTSAQTAAAIETTSASLRYTNKEEASAYIWTTASLTEGDVIHFRLIEQNAATAVGAAFVTFAFGV